MARYGGKTFRVEAPIMLWEVTGKISGLWDHQEPRYGIFKRESAKLPPYLAKIFTPVVSDVKVHL